MQRKKLLKQFERRLLIQRYRSNTIKTYLGCVSVFLEFFAHNNVQEVSFEMIERYIKWLIREKRIGASYQKQILFAITLFYKTVYNTKIDLYPLYPKHQQHTLPTRLSTSDVRKMLAVTVNLKHKSILSLLYAGGLRLSELINLKLTDVDSTTMLILIRQSKGKEARKVMLSEKLLVLLRSYYKMYYPKYWLFEGRSNGRYSPKGVQNIVKEAARKAGITKNITPHTLRHSFAIHLLENGIDIRYIQDLMGHQSIKTTEKYTRITDVSRSKIKSPFDLL